MKKLISTCICTLVFCLCLSTLTFAGNPFEGIWRKMDEELRDVEGLIVGLGVRSSSRPYVRMDSRFWPVPIIIGKYKRLYLDGTSAAVILTDREDLYLSGVIKPRLMGYGTGDSTFLSGMEDRDWSVDAGARVTWDNEYFLLNVTGLSDIGSVSSGHIIEAVASKAFLEGGVTPRLGLKWESKETVDYYFGVQGNEATAIRPAYQGDATLNYMLGITLAYPFGDHWTALADIEYEGFTDEIQDSPIIEDNANLVFVIGGAYRF